MQRILITRPEPGASQTAARLEALGFLPIVAPILSIVPQNVYPPEHIAATLLTSRNAVAACSPALYGRPVFTVGPATATQAAHAGFRRVLNADGDMTMLVTLVVNTLAPENGTLFLPTGKRQGADLATSLRQHGFRVVRRIAYRTEGIPALPEIAVTNLRDGKLAAAMFFSGETSSHFVRLVQAARLADSIRAAEAVSISERAAMALRVLPWRRISVAAKPNQDAMLVLLQ